MSLRVATPDGEKSVEELVREAYERGVREGQARMDNSGRLLYQQGYRDGARRMAEEVRHDLVHAYKGFYTENGFMGMKPANIDAALARVEAGEKS